MADIATNMKAAILKLPLIVLALSISAGHSRAQSDEEPTKDSASESVGPKKFWQADLPAGSYTVALEHIVSISKHRSILDGKTCVTEVVIDTSGGSLARFYLLESAVRDTHQSASKEHPAASHAKTVDFLLSNAADLNKLYDSARSAWISAKGKKFTIHAQKTAPPDH